MATNTNFWHNQAVTLKLRKIVNKTNIRRGVVFLCLVAIGVALLPPPRTHALGNGDGFTIYGESGVNTPRWRTWTNASNTFGAEQSLPTASDNTHHVRIATAPNRQEAVAGVYNANLTDPLKMYHYDGTTWVLDWVDNPGFNPAALRFDVAYSQVSGKAIAVYSANVTTTNELRYRTYDGSSWSAEQNLDTVRTSNGVGYVKALARPGTDEIAILWGDNSNMDMSANYYNMANNTWSGEPAAALSTSISRNGTGTSVNTQFADMAFEQSSGQLVVCWGNNNVTDLSCVERTAGTAGTWGTVTTYTGFAVEPVEVHLASEPGTDYIAYTAVNDAGTPAGEVGIWDGSTWGNISNYDSALNSADASTTSTSVGWVKSGAQSRVVVTYDDVLTASIDWLVFNKNTPGWAVQTPYTGSVAMSNFNDRAHLMYQNPYNNSELMFMLHEFGDDLLAKKVSFDGSTITWTDVEGGAALDTNMIGRSTGYAWSQDFAYYGMDNTGVIDPTAGESGTYHDGTSPATVFTTNLVGYSFYRDRSGACGYSKTTDGGSTWGVPVATTPTGCHHVAVWYDRWTPGDNTGTYIYIVSSESTTNDLKYNRLDTSSDTLLSGAAPVAITSSPGPSLTNTLVSDDNYPSITKATNGTVYTGMHDSGTAGDQSYVIKCSTTCETASNWSSTSAPLQQDPTALAKDNSLLLQPLAGGDIMAIVDDTTNSDILSTVYHSGTSSWDGAFTTIDNNASFSSVYSGNGVSATVDKRNNDIYLVYTADAATLGTDDDFRTARYSSGSWSAKTDVLTNDSKGLVQAQIALNQNTNDVYVGYLARTTAATASTTNVYWKKSTDGMTTWGTEQGPLNTVTNYLWGLRLNVMSNERIFAMWSDSLTVSSEPRTMYGKTVADLTPATFAQSAYRLFNNADSADVGSALAAQDTGATLASSGGAFRARMLLHVGGDGARSNIDDFKLQYAGKGAGTCASPSGTPSSYTDVTGSTPIAYNDNAAVSDGANLTANANDPTHSSDTIRSQTYEESNNFSNTVAAIATGEDGKWDFALKDNSAPGNTTYCLRAVKSDNTALTSYTQYPEVTTALANQSPNSPTSLAQKLTNDTVLNTGDWTSQTSIKFTASASDPDSTDTLQLCVEKQPLGTAFNSNAGSETCGSGVSYSGSPVSVNVTIASHSDDAYHWQARVKDASGNYSSWVSYGGNAESAQDYGVDATAPTGGTVYDGSSVGIDATFNTGALDSLSANWSGFNANVSGLSRYDYSIGTTAGGTDVKAWTSNGTGTSVSATGLSLQTTTRYFVNVRAVDNAGNIQSAVSSDGQMALPTLSFGVAPSSVNFNALNAGNSYTDTQTTTITTSTNAYAGYVVRAFATTQLQAPGGSTIADFSGGTYAAPDSWQSGDTGLGFTSSDTTIQGVNLFQAATCPGGSALAAPGCYAPFSHTGPGDIVADHTTNVSGTPISNEAFTLTYRVTTPSSQPAAAGYATTIVYTISPQY